MTRAASLDAARSSVIPEPSRSGPERDPLVHCLDGKKLKKTGVKRATK